tara:strand:+ start:1204 stop:1500 length:297 start_codon:yes stop_codon:yes gene_type:complete
MKQGQSIKIVQAATEMFGRAVAEIEKVRVLDNYSQLTETTAIKKAIEELEARKKKLEILENQLFNKFTDTQEEGYTPSKSIFKLLDDILTEDNIVLED